MISSPQLEKDKQMLCISSNEHYLAAGIDCYNKAVNKLVASNKQDLALKLCVEVSNSQGMLYYSLRTT